MGGYDPSVRLCASTPASPLIRPRNLNSTRYPIPDVPVVYLVEPTPANIQVVTNDLARGLYSPAYVNFLSSVPRPLLEDFASQIASTDTAEHIAQVFDQYLNFIVAEPDLFSLGLGNDAYWKINSAQTSDEDLDAVVDRIVSGLFSVSVTMGMYNWAWGRTHVDRTTCNRCHPDHPVSQGRSGGINSDETGSETARPYSKLEG